MLLNLIIAMVILAQIYVSTQIACGDKHLINHIENQSLNYFKI